MGTIKKIRIGNEDYEISPVAQESTSGTVENYIYSEGNALSGMAGTPRTVLGGTSKLFTNSGKLLLRFGYWGAAADYSDKMYATFTFPTATSTIDGVMSSAHVRKLEELESRIAALEGN